MRYKSRFGNKSRHNNFIFSKKSVKFALPVGRKEKNPYFCTRFS